MELPSNAIFINDRRKINKRMRENSRNSNPTQRRMAKDTSSMNTNTQNEK